MFIDDLLIKLQQSKLGCYIHNYCLNALMFADDLFLLSISVSELQQMVLICKNELDLLDMTVNTNKSMCMRIGKRFNVTISNLTIDQCSIPWAKEIRYPGVYTVAAKKFKCNLHYARLKYFRSISKILGTNW